MAGRFFLAVSASFLEVAEISGAAIDNLAAL